MATNSPSYTQIQWTANTILGFLADHVETLRGFGVKRLGLFGSYVRGEQTPESDMDFLVEMEPITFDAYFDLKFWLEDAFQKSVDLIIAKNLRVEVRPYVLPEVKYVEGL